MALSKTDQRVLGTIKDVIGYGDIEQARSRAATWLRSAASNSVHVKRSNALRDLTGLMS